jgi:hypothetical protein
MRRAIGSRHPKFLLPRSTLIISGEHRADAGSAEEQRAWESRVGCARQHSRQKVLALSGCHPASRNAVDVREPTYGPPGLGGLH